MINTDTLDYVTGLIGDYTVAAIELVTRDTVGLERRPFVLAETCGRATWLTVHPTEAAARAATEPGWTPLGVVDLTAAATVENRHVA